MRVSTLPRLPRCPRYGGRTDKERNRYQPLHVPRRPGITPPCSPCIALALGRSIPLENITLDKDESTMGRSQPANRAAERNDGRIIIHFVSCQELHPHARPVAHPLESNADGSSQDYDCFYASVFEAENPALRSLPLAVQQKQIIVTCNYEARRRGLHKLQLIREARKQCPDVIVVLGEDLTRFRNASKELYHFLQGFCWSRKVERLGFDEVRFTWRPCSRCG